MNRKISIETCRKAGASRSAAKVAAAKRNGRLGGRPRKQSQAQAPVSVNPSQAPE